MRRNIQEELLGFAGHHYFDLSKFWQFVDSLDEDERRLIHLLWDEDGCATEMSVAAGLRQIGVKRSCYDRARRKLMHPIRRKSFLFHVIPTIESVYAAVEYGYA